MCVRARNVASESLNRIFAFANDQGAAQKVTVQSNGTGGLKTVEWQTLGQRSEDYKAANKTMRQQFLAALKEEFGEVSSWPPSVRKAMNVGDFLLDRHGNVKSERPLTLYRIDQVRTAVVDVRERIAAVKRDFFERPEVKQRNYSALNRQLLDGVLDNAVESLHRDGRSLDSSAARTLFAQLAELAGRNLADNRFAHVLLNTQPERFAETLKSLHSRPRNDLFSPKETADLERGTTQLAMEPETVPGQKAARMNGFASLVTEMHFSYDRAMEILADPAKLKAADIPDDYFLTGRYAASKTPESVLTEAVLDICRGQMNVSFVNPAGDGSFQVRPELVRSEEGSTVRKEETATFKTQFDAFCGPNASELFKCNLLRFIGQGTSNPGSIHETLLGQGSPSLFGRRVTLTKQADGSVIGRFATDPRLSATSSLTVRFDPDGRQTVLDKTLRINPDSYGVTDAYLKAHPHEMEIPPGLVERAREAKVDLLEQERRDNETAGLVGDMRGASGLRLPPQATSDEAAVGGRDPMKAEPRLFVYSSDQRKELSDVMTERLRESGGEAQFEQNCRQLAFDCARRFDLCLGDDGKPLVGSSEDFEKSLREFFGNDTKGCSGAAAVFNQRIAIGPLEVLGKPKNLGKFPYGAMPPSNAGDVRRIVRLTKGDRPGSFRITVMCALRDMDKYTSVKRNDDKSNQMEPVEHLPKGAGNYYYSSHVYDVSVDEAEKLDIRCRYAEESFAVPPRQGN